MAVRRGISTFRTPQRNVSSTSVVRSADNSTPHRTDMGRRAQLVPGTDRTRDATDGTPPSVTPYDPDNPATGEISMKRLYEQQIELTSKIEEVLNGISTRHTKSKCSIPRELSAIVHECYQRLSEDDDDQRQEWDFTVRFDDPNNHRVNRELVTNVLAVGDQSYDITLTKRALRTYFKSKKSEDHKRKSGRSSAIAASCRKRQRRHNKAKARLRVLRQSTTLDEASKRKLSQCCKQNTCRQKNLLLKTLLIVMTMQTTVTIQVILIESIQRLVKSDF